MIEIFVNFVRQHPIQFFLNFALSEAMVIIFLVAPNVDNGPQKQIDELKKRLNNR